MMIGAIKTLTLCHHAEAIADVEGKRYHEYTMPVRLDGTTVWQQYRTIDTFYGTLPYWDRDDLNITGWAATMTDQAIAAGTTTHGTVNDCPFMLIDAPRPTRAMRKWFEANF